MAMSIPLDHPLLFEDVLSVVRVARSATPGWRTICVRARRAVGRALVDPLSALDLDDEIPGLSARVRALVAKAPADVDTLVFGLFDGVEDERGLYAGFYLGGASHYDPRTRWLLDAPSWLPPERFLESPALDEIARVGRRARGEARRAVSHTLLFGAAMLLGRFAAAGLSRRVVVAFDEGEHAVVVPGPADVAPVAVEGASFQS